MMKEQIESLATFICDTCRERTKCENTTPCAMADIVAKAIIKAGWCKQSEWISVTERMPPALGKVLVYSPMLGVYMTCYTAYSPRFAEESVTHWMPLPEPPEKKGGAE